MAQQFTETERAILRIVQADLPDTLTPYSDGIFWATIGCFVLLPIVGWICNVVAMHFYPLTKEKMEEIQDEVAQIKMKAMAENA